MRIFLAGTLLLATCWTGSLMASRSEAAPHLTGTFIQLLTEHGSWTPAQWNQLFEWLRRAGIDHLVVQWSVYDDAAFYSSSEWKRVPNTPLETALNLADSSHMSVLVGLVQDRPYWSNIGRDPDSVASYLRQLRTRSAAAARELVPILQRYRCVEGWYISSEIDDVNWRRPENRQLLFDYAGGLAGDLRSLNPRMKIAISAFSQAQSSPDGFQQFWDAFFQRTVIDTVLFQDGVGVNKLDLREVSLYADALRNAARKNNRSVLAVVELFQQVAGPPIDNSAFRAVPAPLDRIRKQIEIAAKYSPGSIIGFSVPEYMTPLGGAAGANLLAQYQTTLSDHLNSDPGR